MFGIFKEKRKTADEQLGKYVAGIAESVIPMPTEWREAMNQLIRAKAQRISSEQELFGVIMYNTQFFIDVERGLVDLLGEYLSAGKFPGGEQCQSAVGAIIGKHQGTKFVSRELRDAYNKYDSIQQKLDAALFDFIYNRTYYTNLGNMFNVIVSNRPVQDFLVNYESAATVQEIKKYATVYTNLLLDNYSLR